MYELDEVHIFFASLPVLTFYANPSKLQLLKVSKS